MKKLIIAVDGTAGSGKTATFSKVAKEIGYTFIDTGLMYRAFTAFCIENNIDFTNKEQILKMIPLFNYEIINSKIFVNNIDLTHRLQEIDVVKNINSISVIPEIREMMVKKQRELALNKKETGVIELGRDITSVVLPDADLKIYLDSSVDIRAERRFIQNEKNNIKDMDLDEIKKAIKKRDETDKNRKVGPLILTDDSWYIDNSDMTIDEVVAIVVKKIREMEVID